jgi:hypothetical protein
MSVYYTEQGYWLAQGHGLLRPIVCEGATRREATRGWAASLCVQILERDRAG